jgi:hypothetical protein
MKTLRKARNVAALSIFAMALLSLRPGMEVAHAAKVKICGYKKGSSVCFTDASGNCTEVPCHNAGKTGGFCPNQGCV